MTGKPWLKQPGECYDSRGYPIHPGDLLRTPHFIGPRRKQYYLYHVVGYRTRQAGHVGDYLDGRTYTADWFSACEQTDCHPGLYVWPTIEKAYEYSGKSVPMIRVYILPEDMHRTPTKWRCRMFVVIGAVK